MEAQPVGHPRSKATVKWSMVLPGDWDLFTPFLLDGQRSFFAYNSTTGQLDIASVSLVCGDAPDAESSITVARDEDVVVDPPLPAGNTVFRSFGLLPYFLTYQPGAGGSRVATLGYVRRGDDGKIYVDTWQQVWDYDWSILMPLVVGGEPFYLAYAGDAGTLAISQLAGEQPTVVASDPSWGKGYTSLVSFGISQLFLAYGSADGTAKVATVAQQDEGMRIGQAASVAWEPGWQSLAPLALHDRDSSYLFFLAYNNADIGHTPAIYRMNVAPEQGLLYIDHFATALWSYQDLSVDFFSFLSDLANIYSLSYQLADAMASSGPSGDLRILAIPKPGYPWP